MFKWDGTDVTNIISRSNIYEAKYGKYKYWTLTFPQTDQTLSNETFETVTVCVRNSKNTLPCLVDELKPVFELHKIGTHWCRYGGKFKILYKCSFTNEGYIKEEITLDTGKDFDIKFSDITFKLQVQEIFAFRELLGITCSYLSSVIIRDDKAISYYEPGMLTVDKKIIPFTVLDKWFDDSSVDQVVMRLCKINSVDKLVGILHSLRMKIEQIIIRTDRRNIGYKDCIMNRITERLQTTLNGIN